MALSRIGGSSAAATSIAIPAHQAGDLIVIWAYRDGSTTPPTVPAAGGTVPSFTVIDNPTGANSCSAVCAYAVAAGTTDTSGTWTNATGISVEVWRGQASPPIGGHAQSGASVASGGNISIPAITLTDNSGNSAILGFAGWQTVTGWTTIPAGYTRRSQVATECEAVTKDTTTTSAAYNVSGTASGTGGTRTEQIEIIAGFGNRVSQVAVEAVETVPGAKARVSQIAVEALEHVSAKARVSQVAVEVLQTKTVTAKNRVSQIAIEVLQKSVHTFAATISGHGTLSATVRRSGQIIATIAGTSSLSATFRRLRRFTASISGVGHLSATLLTRAHTFTASIAGSSSLSATLRRVKAFTATIAGSGSLTATLRRVRAITATITGQGSLSATVNHPSSGPHTFTATISGRGSLHVQPRIIASSGTFFYSADAPTVYPLVGTNAQWVYKGDNPAILGALQASSGVFVYKGDSPHMAGTIAAPSGAFRFLADPPALWASFKPIVGKIFWRGDAPNIFPLKSPSGKFLWRGDAPTLVPITGVSGRFRYAGDGPNVYPLKAPSGVVVYKAGTPTIGAASIIIHEAGIIRWRADVPVVTPLTEPPPPPPPVSGTGLKVQTTV